MKFKIERFDVAKFDAVLARGLSSGLGKQGGQVCIEAAICETLGLEHGDDPKCVAEAVRSFKITLNDSCWSSPQARATGLRDLGLAQLGSKGVVDNKEFAQLLAKKTIQVLIPKLFREVFPNNANCLAAADRCEKEGTVEAARAAASAAWAVAGWAAEAAWAARAAWAADKTAWATDAAKAAEAAEAASAASVTWAAGAARLAAGTSNDEYLLLSASLALDTLRELKSPGIALLDKPKEQG